MIDALAIVVMASLSWLLEHPETPWGFGLDLLVRAWYHPAPAVAILVACVALFSALRAYRAQAR